MFYLFLSQRRNGKPEIHILSLLKFSVFVLAYIGCGNSTIETPSARKQALHNHFFFTRKLFCSPGADLQLIPRLVYYSLFPLIFVFKRCFMDFLWTYRWSLWGRVCWASGPWVSAMCSSTTTLDSKIMHVYFRHKSHYNQWGILAG